MAHEVRRVAAKGVRALTWSENPEKIGVPSSHSEHWGTAVDPAPTEMRFFHMVVRNARLPGDSVALLIVAALTQPASGAPTSGRARGTRRANRPCPRASPH